ncbi:N-acetylneuraminate synthase family protein [Pseudodesulfovibrio methanolicus]|uniref:N-acetylneuraminate synthase family protein n=1 Tax=Pseudodesulfovibrio methanolicus TaxID=3126690 RepID=A0ABZ2IXK1_9BACT
MNSDFARTLTLGERVVGPGHPVFIIAEVGVNHNGDMDLAKKMVDVAADAGADCVKFQTFRSEEFMADRDMIYEYRNRGETVRESMYEMFKRLEFPLERHRELFDYARSKGVVPLTSVADPICMRAAIESGATALKLASEDLINLPLLGAVAAQGLPLILSTGMADEREVRDAMEILYENGCMDTAFLHCVSLYPTPDSEANLARMRDVANLTGAVTGYSDHTSGVEACLAATALGARILEKHFTLDRGMTGPDHAFSADPVEFRALVEGVRRVERQMGAGGLVPGPVEEHFRHEFRRSVVAARDLPAGAVLGPDDLALKRPGNGIHPRDMRSLCGRTLKAALRKDEQLTRETVE